MKRKKCKYTPYVLCQAPKDAKLSKEGCFVCLGAQLVGAFDCVAAHVLEERMKLRAVVHIVDSLFIMGRLRTGLGVWFQENMPKNQEQVQTLQTELEKMLKPKKVHYIE